MTDENFSHDETVNDLIFISDKLGTVIRIKKKEIEDIQGVQRNVGALTDYWQAHPIPTSPSANASIVSGSNLIHDFRGYVEGLKPEEFAGPVLGSIVASGDTMGSVGLTLMHIAPPPEPARKELEIKFIEIKEAPGRKERRKEVKAYLQKISSHLVQMYDGAWESLETNYSDPARGAAFQMREVVSQVLDFLSGNQNGLTRRDKLEHIAANRAKDNSQKELIKSSIKAFLDNYEALNEAHKRKPLDKGEVESLLFQADDLLNLILGAVRLE